MLNTKGMRFPIDVMLLASMMEWFRMSLCVSVAVTRLFLLLSMAGLAAGDDRAFKVGVALDRDFEAAVAGQNAALLLHAGVVAFNRALADAATDAGALALAVEPDRVLQAFDIEVPPISALTCLADTTPL